MSSLLVAMSPSIVALLIFLAVTFGCGALLLAMQDMLAARAGGPNEPALQLRRFPRAAEHPGRGPLGRFDRWFLRLVQDTGLSIEPVSAALLIGLSGALVAGGLFLWGEHSLVTLGGLIVGAVLPLVYLVYRQRKRIKQLQNQLPAALDMLARSVRAGQSLDQALASVGRHSPKPLAAEFRQCARQLQMGLSMPAVMRSLVERVRLYDVRIFTTTLTVHRQTGGNIAVLLERLARVIRDRLSYRRQLRVSTGAGKASAILVSLTTPFVFLFFFVYRPDYVSSMLNSPIGQSFLVAAIVLELIGLIWTIRLLKPTY